MVKIIRVRLNRQGYDSHGQYWGIGEPLFYALDDSTGSTRFFRCPSYQDARRLFKAKGRNVAR